MYPYEPYEGDDQDDIDITFDDILGMSLEGVSSLEREELLLLAQKFVALEMKVGNLPTQLDHFERCDLNDYLQLGLNNETKYSSLLKEIDYLLYVTKTFVALIRTEEKAMKALALDDPGAYAKMLSYRRKYISRYSFLGQYSKNNLSTFLTENKESDRDHSHWFHICESQVLENSYSRVSAHLERLPIDENIFK
ncbi:hypothetical protein [Vibrio mangrovi]|uniref:Uncharacterized protein n=1 Tax=Vibrio mangrovi TaxID=474394 RepID=A0A1Y6J133_9VIBR|nr:hypothetical protein [Vibrio mangrovi]MDW6002332.1 hypothetical protein [Vibrio mangrovi]SMS02770.1 hypothetical protein VIM7927_04110 [Vibrio mangrovi]